MEATARKNGNEPATQRVLWTGGWDSTLWILRVIEESDHVIEPHYVLHPTRPSAEIELRTMENLRRLIVEHRPQAAGRIRDVRVTHINRIPEFPEHEAALSAMRRDRHVGGQYLWLANYCRAYDIGQIDLCSEANTALAHAFGDRVERTPGSLENYALPPEDSAEYTLCRWFRLPLVLTDKPTMTRMAEARGWMPVLRHTWFCHKPVMGRYACGTCRPCVYLMDRKQYFRMGKIGKMRFYTLEKSKRMLPTRLKDSLRRMAGPKLRHFLRA